MSNLRNVKDLHQNYVNAGKLLEGFEKYYAENVVTQELGEEPRVGKNINRTHEINFLQNIKEVHGGDILSFAEAWFVAWRRSKSVPTQLNPY